ncbi:Transcriptional regulator, TetR family protein [Sandaracinus amylolyticus]|uniref:Transcriptional regulator, TetR family protein n=2 Tax=Sandaracinus amylolyticus TaxID=927083 RepID=A0A0F6YJD1_9BACT|nr:Transcriptional regulator, TetR family protein [Sandaracinus amylolyticus]
MPRSPKDNQEIRDARREEILAAAARVFAAKGLSQSKISDIAAAANLSHGLVYHYFDSKDSIFGAIVDQMIAKIDADLASDGELTAYQRLVAGIERSRDRVCAGGLEPGRVVAQAMMQGVIPDHLRGRIHEHFGRLHRRIAERIEEAQRDGDIEPDADPVELASALVCLMRGLSMRAPDMPHLPFPIPRTDTILRLLRPSSAPQDTRRATPRAARGPNARRR